MSRNCILFIAPIIKFSAFFGIVPFYNFETHNLTNVKLFKFYSALVACLVPALSAGMLYLRFVCVYDGANRNFVVLDFILEIISFLSLEVSILGSSFWNILTWRDLFRLLHRIEDKDNLNAKTDKCASVFLNANFVFVAGSVVLFVLFSYEFYYHFEEQCVSFCYISVFLYFYTEFAQVNILSNIALSIRCKYEGTNRLFESAIYDCVSENTIKHIRKVKVLFLTVDRIVAEFNKLFGFPILLKLAHAVVMMVISMVVALLTPLKIKGVEYRVTAGLISINTAYAMIAWVSTTLTNMFMEFRK